MRTTVALATFVALGAGTTAVGALNNISDMQGSDTLFTITRDLVDDAPVLAITYIGTGSSSGQSRLTAAAPTQLTSPMSRAVNNNVCSIASTAAGEAEGIVFALDALSVVVNDAIATTCSAAAGGSCASNASGIAFNNTKTFTVSDLNGVAGIQCRRAGSGLAGCTGGDASATYAVQSFRDVLRIVAAGMGVGNNTLALRDCNSDLRHSLVASYSNLFQGSCTTTGCTSLQHFFVRDAFSGTTDVFLSLLQLPSLNLETTTLNSPFCYTRLSSDDWAAPPGPPRANPPYYGEYQDADPIRRACVGTNNNVFNAANPAEPPDPTLPAEQVCGAMGTLGLVLPINPQPGVPVADSYPSAPCSKGKFAVRTGPFKNSFESDVCPNGDKPIGGQNCFVPVTPGNSAQCLNGANNLPGVLLAPAQGIATDGRVYNLHLKDAAGAYRTAKRPIPDGVLNGATLDAIEVGAFYRIHTTRSLIASAPTTGVCTQDDATQQIACLTVSSPCSAGYAGREGPALQAGASGVRVNGIPGDVDTCVQALISGGTLYPLSRKLYFNTLTGFEDGSVNGTDEGELAERYSGVTNAKVSANGFVPMPAGPICEDFNEMQCPAAPAGVLNINGCAGNPAGVVSGTAFCGNGVTEQGETCDDGNATAGDGCNLSCSGA